MIGRRDRGRGEILVAGLAIAQLDEAAERRLNESARRLVNQWQSARLSAPSPRLGLSAVEGYAGERAGVRGSGHQAPSPSPEAATTEPATARPIAASISQETVRRLRAAASTAGSDSEPVGPAGARLRGPPPSRS